MAIHYRDRHVTLDEDGVTIHRYYFPAGDKRITYDRIRRVDEKELGLLSGRWRIWGTGDLRHWYHLDTNRPFKHRALVLDLGERLVPVLTPDDPDAVLRLLRERIARAPTEQRDA
jgi:hypothetical protein